MLSYRHGFHAGNFADVFKHLVLMRLIHAMQRKERGFLYLETHAGAGGYDLHSGFAAKLREHKDGIGLLWERKGLPPAIAEYVALVSDSNPDGKLRHYPGSPLIAQKLLRPQDRLALCELHPSEQTDLKALFGADRRVRLHFRDGLEAMRALLPPPEQRGLIHIDPAYEGAEEHRQVAKALTEAASRWPAGNFALWYPLLPGPGAARLPAMMKRSGLKNILNCELKVRPQGPGMFGCGMVLINPPWQIDLELQEILPQIAKILSPERGSARVEWLAGE